ncbi:glycosyltransferase family 39 protein [Dysgonomonas sp. Marseille-P4677]|uniref:glycosyltransferase family 39 protein n=1 Tax=Dysgonomonas sp. Marseille-P4677 TaxID=2364790 RepID=UPI00191165C7|nr:glycosyltransferase family 39 protein [Dysgonomonas sp. Marseille-P4677]MBK5721645.1 glycosyltransferase family 39 protein [Dysgonomonas sp. Marseille-P4677]
MKISKGVIYVLLLVFSGCLFAYLDIKDTSIPYDDAYSVFMIKASYADIWKITASDVHPPLYYWGLKTFSGIFGDSIAVLRFFSLLGIFSVLLLGCFPIRQQFGDRVAILFLILIIIFPVTQYLVTDIRMYSWTMFFVLACALCGYKVFKRERTKDWGLFLFTSVCAAYLHNYGLLSVLGIYSILFICLFSQKKNWSKLIVCGLLFIAIYSPWLFPLISQVRDVSQDYWIKPLTINDLFLHIYYFYSPKEVWLPFSDFTKLQMMIGLIFLMSIQLLLTLKILASFRWKDKVVRFAILSFLAFLLPILIGAFISLVYLPVLATRYMTCSFGLFVLSMAFVFSKIYEFPKYKKLLYLFLFLLFVDGGFRLYSGVKYYNQTEIANENIARFVGNTEVFLVNDFSYHVMPRLELIIPERKYYVLIQNHNIETFRPFIFNIIEDESSLGDEFVLVHQEREAIQSDFRIYQASLKDRYLTIDSLHASDIYLYRLKKLDIIN